MALAVGAAAAGCDLTRRKIPNPLTVCGLAGALALHTLDRGWRGSLFAIAGALAGFAMFLVFYLARGMGAGDLKLMAVFGALLGPGGIAVAALFAAIVGGLMVLAWMLACRRARAIPYAPAIVLGAWLALLAGR